MVTYNVSSVFKIVTRIEDGFDPTFWKLFITYTPSFVSLSQGTEVESLPFKAPASEFWQFRFFRYAIASTMSLKTFCWYFLCILNSVGPESFIDSSISPEHFAIAVPIIIFEISFIECAVFPFV